MYIGTINNATRGNEMKDLKELEINVVASWLSTGAIRIVDTGEENTYYVDLFDRHFFCKNL